MPFAFGMDGSVPAVGRGGIARKSQRLRRRRAMARRAGLDRHQLQRLGAVVDELEAPVRGQQHRAWRGKALWRAVEQQLAAAGERQHHVLVAVPRFGAARAGFEPMHADLEGAHAEGRVGSDDTCRAVAVPGRKMGVMDDDHGDCVGAVG